jgi:hypothetical protein
MNKRVYSRSEIPYEGMKDYPMLYSQEEIESQKSRQKAGTQLRIRQVDDQVHQGVMISQPLKSAIEWW